MSKETAAGHSVLLPPEPQEGGLIIKSGVKRNPDVAGSVGEKIEFKVPQVPENSQPRVSLLGLDRLAAKKRLEKQQQSVRTETKADEEPTSKRSKVYSSYKEGDVEEQEFSSSSSSSSSRDKDKSRHYRDRDEKSSATPTPHHRLYHQDYKSSSKSDSKSKGIYASSNKNGK
jgi:hypothetical protein